MIVGSNERRYAWMDEGFDTYSTQSPLMTAADRINASALAAIGFRKLGAVMLALRNHVVGREILDAAFAE